MAPGVAVQVSTVGYGSIRPLAVLRFTLRAAFLRVAVAHPFRGEGFLFLGCTRAAGRRILRPKGLSYRSGLAPSLDLVPGTFSQARKRLRLRRFGKIDRRKACRAQERVHQGAILGSEARDLILEHSNVFCL